MPRILLIDDDQALAEPLHDYLLTFDLQMESVTHPAHGLKLIRLNPPDLVILDIILTARGDVMDRVVGLELGADDNPPNPSNPANLWAASTTS